MAKCKSTVDIQNKKKKGEKITALTAYDYYQARVLDEADIDIVLVGDSLGMVFAGYPNTLPVTVEQMYYHCQVVRRGCRRALVTADMPFLSYQTDEKSALENCGKFIKEGAAKAVKIEGGNDTICSRIERLVETGIPVMGHVGLTPQLIETLGGFRVQGKTEEEAKIIIESAKRVQDAGAFCIVLEAVPPALAKEITSQLCIPTIGIGAGPNCDGQILVISDILGMVDEISPKFVRKYADTGKIIRKAVSDYIADVKSGDFPASKESY